MEKVIKHHFNKKVISKTELDSRHEVYLLVLEDDSKLIFRAETNYYDIFIKEKYFFDEINKSIGKVCPEVLFINKGSCLYNKDFQIEEFIEGITLNEYLFKCSDEEKRIIYFKIGQLVAKVHNIEINKDNSMIKDRTSFREYFTNKLQTNLTNILKNNLITNEEINIICNKMKTIDSKYEYSFMHLDIRPQNIIMNNDSLFLIDAETYDFGNPIKELAFMSLEWSYWEMFDVVLEGYKTIKNIDINQESLFDYYRLEWIADLLDMHYNYGCKDNTTEKFLSLFNDIKNRLLNTK